MQAGKTKLKNNDSLTTYGVKWCIMNVIEHVALIDRVGYKVLQGVVH